MLPQPRSEFGDAGSRVPANPLEDVRKSPATYLLLPRQQHSEDEELIDQFP